MKRSWLLLLLTLPAFAEFDVRLGEVVFGGTGCSPDNTKVILSPDGNVLGMTFTAYIASALSGQGTSLDRKSCNIAVPIEIPAGYSVAMATMDINGLNNLPLGSFSTFNAEYFFAGSTGPVLQKRFDGPRNEPYEIKNLIPEPALVWSPCGGSTILRANTSVVVQNTTNLEASSRVENMGALPGFLFNLRWKRC